MGAENPIQTYGSLLSSSKFLFIVYYRGHWCPFCMAYLSTLHTLESPIAAAGGKILVVTSEPEIHLPATRTATGYKGIVLVDTKNELATYLRDQKLVDVAISSKKDYEHGMAQPAILVVKQADNGTTEVVERWAIVPGLMNLGGAKDRPDLGQVWENVQAKLKGDKVVYAKYSLTGALGLLKGKILG